MQHYDELADVNSQFGGTTKVGGESVLAAGTGGGRQCYRSRVTHRLAQVALYLEAGIGFYRR
jgi:hypothetical protein